MLTGRNDIFNARHIPSRPRLFGPPLQFQSRSLDCTYSSFETLYACYPRSFPTIRIFFPDKWQTFHRDWYSHLGRKIYQQRGSDIIAFVSLFQHDEISCCDPAAVLEFKVNRFSHFGKDMVAAQKVAMYGPNLISTDGDEWKFHRKIAARGFPQKTIQLVHSETARQTIQMMEAWSKQIKDSSVDIQKHSNIVLSLHVICGAGYGMPLDWESSEKPKDGFRMSFIESLRCVVDNILILFIVPSWLYRLPIRKLRQVKQGKIEFGMYMRELIELEMERKITSENSSVIRSLVESSATSSSELSKQTRMLTDVELMGNAFILLLGGHESTATVLMYALTMLAVHQEIQEIVYKEVKDVCGDRLPMFADIQSMAFSLCVMYETMRCFPIIGALPHVVASGHDETLLNKYPIPKTAIIQMDLQNLHRNENYWGSDVDEFNPSRFMLDKSDKERDYVVDGKIKVPAKGAFVGFSEGPRACLGRQFAETEFLTFMSMVVQKWSIHLGEGWNKQRAMETARKRITVLTTVPLSIIPLTFKKR